MKYLRISLYFAITLLTLSCGGASDSLDTNTGGISFNLVWETPPSLSKPDSSRSFFAPAPDVCNDFGIASITMRVQNSSGGTVSSQNFTCSAHSGVVNTIPAGSGYSLIIEGLLANNSIAWTGTRTSLSVTANQTTAAGTITMTYQGADITTPTVLVTNPASVATSVPITSPITATFSEDMAISSISETTFTLRRGVSSVTGTVTYNTTNRTATLTPAVNLLYSTVYTATVATGVKDMANRGTGSAYTWSFTTEATPGSAPSAPTGVAAAAGNAQNTITWNASTGATSYNIYWLTTAGVTTTSGTKITGATTPYTHTGRTNGTTYYYIVTAQNSFGESIASAPVASATPTAGGGGAAPAAPTGVAATAGNALNTISWSTSTGATSYNIYWSATSGVTKINSTKLIGTTSPYIHYGRTNGTAYYYVVTAVNAAGESVESSQVFATPQVPTTWVTKAPMSVTRERMGMAAVGGKIYAMGGLGGGVVRNSVEAYDPLTNSWAPMASMSIARECSAAVVNGIIYAIGGATDGAGTTTTLVEAYNPSTDSWTTKASMPTTRRGTSAVAVNGVIYVIGGGSTGYLSTVEAYDPLTNSWTTKTSMPTARAWMGAAAVDNVIYVIGGDISGGDTSAVESYNPGTNAWTAGLPAMPTVRNTLTAEALNGVIYAIGGYQKSTATYGLSTVEAYTPSPSGGSWTTGLPPLGSPRYALSSAKVKGVLYAIGGARYSGGQSYYAVVEAYTPPLTPDSWWATSTIGAPIGRSSHAAVWTGSEMIVWGGSSSNPGETYYNTGGKYDPATDSWIPTSTTNAPAARRFVPAVWTGTEMIVWGGSDGTVVNTGGKYNPATDTWIATSTVNAPSARSTHSLVWTGTEMIAWGGTNAANIAMNDGAKYNPSSDTWTATSLTNVPVGTWQHVAVWTGTEMIVWGGAPAPGTLTNTGGRYNPSTNTWTSTSTVNVPVARANESVIWTGTEMIVWGGNDGGGFYNTGARYNPSADTWSTTSLTNAPSARLSHTAVWTGDEMIIWGGRDFSNVVPGPGGKYNPSTNIWTATTATGAPADRADHTAIWTGRSMTIWGGRLYLGNITSDYLNTGGKYQP